jgi:hypothetical protein
MISLHVITRSQRRGAPEQQMRALDRAESAGNTIHAR